jgi:hypothetical protein
LLPADRQTAAASMMLRLWCRSSRTAADGVPGDHSATACGSAAAPAECAGQRHRAPAESLVLTWMLTGLVLQQSQCIQHGKRQQLVHCQASSPAPAPTLLRCTHGLQCPQR